MHALDCIKDGFMTQKHNEMRGTLGDLASIAFKDVKRTITARGIPADLLGIGKFGRHNLTYNFMSYHM